MNVVVCWGGRWLRRCSPVVYAGSRWLARRAVIQRVAVDVRNVPVDYGADAQSVYSAFYEAYVAQKRGALPKDRYCAFQASIAERYSAYKANPGPAAQSAWANFFLDQRAQALIWRASVDPTLCAG